jgi:hypothetical protein
MEISMNQLNQWIARFVCFWGLLAGVHPGAQAGSLTQTTLLDPAYQHVVVINSRNSSETIRQTQLTGGNLRFEHCRGGNCTVIGEPQGYPFNRLLARQFAAFGTGVAELILEVGGGGVLVGSVAPSLFIYSGMAVAAGAAGAGLGVATSPLWTGKTQWLLDLNPGFQFGKAAALDRVTRNQAVSLTPQEFAVFERNLRRALHRIHTSYDPSVVEAEEKKWHPISSGVRIQNREIGAMPIN